MIRLLGKVLTFLTFLSVTNLAVAQLPSPDYRGFNVPIAEVTSDRADYMAQNSNDIANHWHANVIITQIGNDAEQDDVTTVQEYRAMMETELQEFENKLAELCPQGLKVIFNLYSTLGGFANRGEGGQLPNEKLATLQLAQTEFVDFWGEIAERFSDSEYNSCIYGYNLKNEPQLNDLAVGLQTWEELAPLAVAAIREHEPSKLIIVPAAGANVNLLKNLPSSLADDGNVCLGANAYPFLDYQHSGIDGVGTNIPAPSNKKLKTKLWKPLGTFQHKQQKKVDKELQSQLLPVCITEFAVSRFAQDADVFLERLFSSFENENDEAGRGSNVQVVKKKKCKKIGKTQGKAKKKKCLKKRNWQLNAPQVDIKLWMNHAMFESSVWDPRVGPSEGDTAVDLPTLNDRGEVIHEYLQYNLAEE